jgi:hypothetical protein
LEMTFNHNIIPDCTLFATVLTSIDYYRVPFNCALQVEGARKSNSNNGGKVLYLNRSDTDTETNSCP